MRPISPAITALTLSLCLASPASRAAEPNPGTLPPKGGAHAFSVQDLIAFDRLGEPDVSPDGKRVVYSLSRLDLAANRRRADLWLVDVAGGEPRRLTSHEASDGSPVWAPDGASILFLSSRSGSSQVWRIAATGGEAEPVTQLPLDVGAFRISPDGMRLAVALDVFPDCADLACTRARLDADAQRAASGRVYDRLFIRHWDTWSDGRRAHIIVVPLHTAVSATTTAVDIMQGLDADSPGKPFGGSEELAFTPDSRSIVFAARVAGREEAWSTNFDLYLAPIDGSAAPKNITPTSPGTDSAPMFSPDGKTLVWLSMPRAGYESDRYRVMLRDVSGGMSAAAPEANGDRELAPTWDRSPAELVFAKNGKTLFATADDLGHRSLFALDVASGKVRTLTPAALDGSFGAPRIAAQGLVVLRDDLGSPAELHTIGGDGKKLRPLTRHNAARLDNVARGDFAPFTFAGWNGETVHGWIVKPVGFASAPPGKKWPVAFIIHGGPQGSFGNHFHYRWNPQTYAGAGYAAVMIDFHGSTGYGQAFTDSIRGDWGGKPLEDLQKGLAAALAKEPALDGERVCALGASYGGYMINWIAGAWPDRFRCLVTHDGNLDERMAYFNTEELWFPEWDHGGLPWERPENYTKHNPIDLIAKWQTPTLVIHGGQDFRVVDTQGMATFTALQRRGIPSRFLYFPDENHWVLRPANSILWHETVLDWLGRWTR